MGRKAYNNGVKVIFIEEGAEVPEGFVKGGLSFRTKESYIEGGKKSAATQQIHWQEKSDAEKTEWSTRCKEFHLQRTDEQIETRVLKTKETMGKKSEEELLDIKNKKSKSLKTFWDSQTEEYKMARMNKVNSNGGGWNKDTIKTTVMERYGVENIAYLDSIKEKAKQTATATCQERYGVEWACQLPQCFTAIGQHSADSQPNRAFKQLLDSKNIECSTEFVLHKYRYDFKIEDTLIEINPYTTHNSTFGIFGNEGLAKDYHAKKTVTAEQNGYSCIHIFDWDNSELIINSLLNINKQRIGARECDVKKITDIQIVNNFLNTNHLQGTCRGIKVTYGLYIKNTDSLVAVMAFGKPRYTKKYDWELLRLCTKSDYIVLGGSTKLFNQFLVDENPKLVISYCDRSKFSGRVYTQLGFSIQSEKLKPLLHWYHPKLKLHYTAAYINKLGFDKVLGSIFNVQYGKGSSNKELMLKHGFVEIYDCGQQVFIYDKEVINE